MDVGDITRDELPQLAALLRELTGLGTPPDRLGAAHAALAANPDARVLGARHGGRLAGAACGFLCPDIVGACRPFLVVENVVVAPAWRLLGVGRLLMDALEAWGRERGCSYAILVSGPARREAHAFYTALGYEACAGFKKRLAGCGA